MTRALVVLVLGLGVAHADTLQAALGGELTEVRHSVEVHVDGGVARYVVRREIHNASERADEARLVIDLPYGAAASGLRIKAKDRWFDGELLDREVAAQRYEALTGAGMWDPKDPALLHWSSSRQVILQVFPVLPGETSTVEYTLIASVRHGDGLGWLGYPRAEPGMAAPELTVDGAVSLDGAPITGPLTIPAAAVRLDDNNAASSSIVIAGHHGDRRAMLELDVHHGEPGELAIALIAPSGEQIAVHDAGPLLRRYDLALPRQHGSGTWRLAITNGSSEPGVLARWSLTLGGATQASAAPTLIPTWPGFDVTPNQATIAIAAPVATWAGRLGHAVAAEKGFARLELDVAARLSEPPHKAQLVVVLDASYSIGEEQLASQLAIARALARDLPDAEIELVAVRRTARRVFGRFVPAAELPRAIEAARRARRFALGNGSALDAGARLAAELVAPRPGPHRIVLFSDRLVRDALTDELAADALAQLDPAAIVHLVALKPADDEPITRVERDPDDDPLAGFATAHHGIAATVVGLRTPREDLAPAALALVRPTRIEHLEGGDAFGLPDTLVEGRSARRWLQVARGELPSSVVLTGRLWSDPVRLELAVDPAFSRATAGLGFAEQMFDLLDDSEQLALALVGRVVSPVTSYLAIEPGVRPSKIGLPVGGIGWGTIGSGTFGTIGSCRIGHAHYVAPDLAPLVDQERCLRAHPPAGAWHVELAVETTRDEIVEVTVEDGEGPLADCLVEAVWAVRLDSRFDRDHLALEVELSGS